MAAPGKTQSRSRRHSPKSLTPSRHDLLPHEEGPRRARGRALDHYCRGLARQRCGDIGGAVAAFEAAVRWQPGRAEYFVQRALARLGCLDFAEAVLEARREVRLDLGGAWAYYQHRCTRPAEQVLRQAVADFGAALACEQRCLAARLGRGLAQLDLDERTAAADLEAVLAFPAEDACHFWLRGLARLYIGDGDGARADLDEAVNRGLRDAAVHLSRGRVRQLAGDLAGALADFDDAVYLDPRHAGAYHLRGLARQQYGSLDEARADYDTALRLDPQRGCVYNSRAGLRYLEGDCLGARADCEEAIHLDLANPHALANRARLRWTCSGDALADCEAALRLDPRCAWTRCVRGSLHALSRQPYAVAAATDDYAVALQLEPRLARALRAEQAAGGAEGILALSAPRQWTAAVPALQVPASPRREPGGVARTVLGLVVGAALGALAGMLWARLVPPPGGAGRWEVWLPMWALFGGLSMAFAGVLGMRRLVCHLGGYGAGSSPMRTAPGWPPELRALLGLPVALAFRLIGRPVRRWCRPLIRHPAAGWSAEDSPSGGATSRTGRQLAVLSLQALRRTAARALLGGAVGVLAGLLLWAYRCSPVSGVLAGSVIGMLTAFGLVERWSQPPGRWRFVLILGGLLLGGGLSGAAYAAVPGVTAAALAVHHLAEFLRRNGTARERCGPCGLVLLATLLGGVAGAVDGEAVYETIGAVLCAGLWWAPAGALGGVPAALVLAWGRPREVLAAPLGRRIFGTGRRADCSPCRGAAALFAAVAGLLVGGGVGIVAGSLLALAAILPGENGCWIGGGALLSAGLAYSLAVRSVGCQMLLTEEEQLEVVLPRSLLASALIVLGGAAVGAGGGALLGLHAGAGSYGVVAGAGLGTITAARLRALIG
jgi:tetratricopeptide (TPR) repeat protein